MVKNKRDARFYPFLTLNDNTKIIHSEVLEKNGGEQVEVRIKKKKQLMEKFVQHLAGCLIIDGKILLGFRKLKLSIFKDT